MEVEGVYFEVKEWRLRRCSLTLRGCRWRLRGCNLGLRSGSGG